MAQAYASRIMALVAAIAVAAPVPWIAAEPKAAALDPAQNFAIEHEIGRRFSVDPTELPAPKSGPIVTNRVLSVPFGGQTLTVPKGFTATPFAVGLVNPRRLLVLPNGDVLVAEQSAGYLTLLRDDGEGRAKWINRHVEDLNRPYGLAWRNDHLLVADQDGIWRVPHVIGALRAGRPRPSEPTSYRPTSASRCPALMAPRW
jgi:glucose/arabinose dehydrogenase